MDKIQKFLNTLRPKDKQILLAILKDVKILNLKNYQIKPLTGYKGIYRIRKGKFRIVYGKTKTQGLLIEVGYRKDVYK